MNRRAFFGKAFAAAIAAPFAAKALLQESAMGYATGLLSAPVELEAFTATLIPAAPILAPIAVAVPTAGVLTRWAIVQDGYDTDAPSADNWEV